MTLRLKTINEKPLLTNNGWTSFDPVDSGVLEGLSKKDTLEGEEKLMLAVLADAIKRAGSTDGQKVRDALAATKDFDGVTGKITINEKRDATKSAVILQIKDAVWEVGSAVSPFSSTTWRRRLQSPKIST